MSRRWHATHFAAGGQASRACVRRRLRCAASSSSRREGGLNSERCIRRERVRDLEGALEMGAGWSDLADQPAAVSGAGVKALGREQVTHTRCAEPAGKAKCRPTERKEATRDFQLRETSCPLKRSQLSTPASARCPACCTCHVRPPRSASGKAHRRSPTGHSRRGEKRQPVPRRYRRCNRW